ncbi:MAG TPA: ThiF family adenylyltransferase, partial [Nitrospira sp.]|nr:ThiF family adenylyltransferase [Nitrospira sp.]
MDLSESEIQRYSRHIILQDVGGKGQLKLKRAKVLLIGAGGLGSPAGLYLAAAGIGTIGLVDGDVVDLSNLQRQIMHSTATLGQPKVESGRKTLSAINPEI